MRGQTHVLEQTKLENPLTRQLVGFMNEGPPSGVVGIKLRRSFLLPNLLHRGLVRATKS